MGIFCDILAYLTDIFDRDWDLAHSSVSDTIKRARDEVTNYMDLTARGGHDPPPKRPTEHLTHQLRVLEARGPANTAPRPDNQFGDQCVVPAFTQIEKIRKVTDLCEYIAITEPREQAAAATAISFARRRQVQTREAQAVLKRLREEKQEEERAAEEARQVIPTPSHVLGRISPIFSPFPPVFCAFSPPRRHGSNEPQAGTQGQETVSRGSKHRFSGAS